jgi:hypothetical protein
MAEKQEDERDWNVPARAHDNVRGIVHIGVVYSSVRLVSGRDSGPDGRRER